jgi:hypothetical protein
MINQRRKRNSGRNIEEGGGTIRQRRPLQSQENFIVIIMRGICRNKGKKERG